jgi:peptidoglycan/LPS O-acetylase OafA/YrhL
VAGLALLACLPVLGANIQGIGWQMKPYGVALVALTCAGIVWLASYDRNVFSIGRRYQVIMLYLGSRSYSLYLSHLVVYLTVQALFSQFGQGLAAAAGPAGSKLLLVSVAAGLTLLAAELTYRGVESAVRARGRVIAARLVANSRTR